MARLPELLFCGTISFCPNFKENLYVESRYGCTFVVCLRGCRQPERLLRRRLPRELQSVLLRDLRLRLLRHRRLHGRLRLRVRLLRGWQVRLR